MSREPLIEIRAIVDAIPALVAYCDDKMRAVFLNHAYADWFGKTPGELEGMHCRDFLGEEDFAVARPHMAAALAGRQQNYERTIRHPDGTVRHVQACYVPHAAEGRVIGFIALVSDVTVFKEAEAQLLVYRDRLEDLVGERTRQLAEANSLLKKEIRAHKRAASLLDMDRQVLSLIARGADLRQILAVLCDALDRLCKRGSPAVYGVMLPGSSLVNLASGGEARAFAHAAARINQGLGFACAGEAVQADRTVIAAGIDGDPAWKGFARLAKRHGIGASFSLPIRAAGRPLGALSVYYGKAGKPPARDLALAERAVELAAIAFDRHMAQERLQHMATHDALTGLPNRTLFYETLNRAVAAAERRKSRFAVLFVDLDGFKEVNDGFGHDHGDALLKTVAAWLHRSVRKADSVARLGGDEFAVVLADVRSGAQVRRVAGKILDHLARPVAIGQAEVRISCSIGISLYPDHGASADQLLKNADHAMYAAKEGGKNAAHFFIADGVSSEPVLVERDMAGGMENGEFEIHYQPLLDMESRQISSIEALLRWNHPRLGMLLPEKFIPLAEDSGLIVALGRWVMQEATRQAMTWQRIAGQPLRLSVNISPLQMQDDGFLPMVGEALAESAFSPSLLDIEITEGHLLANDQRIQGTLNGLKAMGVHLLIDDFGAGYASLSYLKNFPIDGLKIDQGFIQDLSFDPNAAAIVTAVLALGRALDLEVVAEGVEKIDQEQFLAQRGLRTYQGHLFSEAVPAGSIPALLAGAARFP